MADTASVSEVAALLDEAEQALGRDLPSLRLELRDALSLYDGIPTAVDIFDVLGLHGDEDRHTAFLAWLLDPRGTHGLGDAILRRFLYLVDDASLEPLRASSEPLEAWVTPWLEFPGAGVPDLVLVVEDKRGKAVALVIEAKIHAPLTMSSGEAQTIRYVRAVASPGDLEAHVLKPCRSSSSLRIATCTLVFVFLRADPSQEADPEGVLEQYHYRNVDYGEVERMLGQFVKEMDISANVRALLQQFRTSLLAGALPEAASLSALEDLRQLALRRSAAPDYRRAQQLREKLAGFRGMHQHG